ncbi:TVP38/TMEM64 family protein [Candidatus Woesearchaeota archaeon]|nr:TVP38/TMEM64 family protein [Candidatus Woesearchaeota archaeon]
MNGHFHKLKYVMIIIIVIIIYILMNRLNIVQHYISNPESLQKLMISLGIFAPLAIIGLQILQSLIPILPGGVITIASGFIFGPWRGLLFSLIGAMIGSSIVFFISRRFGKELAVKLMGKKEVVHFHLLFKQKKNWGLYIARMIPIFPSDVVSLGAGLTTISFKQFFIISGLGFLTQMIFYSHFGAKLVSGQISLPLILISAMIIIFILILIFRKYIKELLIEGLQELRKGEKLFKKEEKFLRKEELFLEKEFRRI